MTIMGINFKKMLVERKSSTKGKVSISNNVSVTKVEKVSLNLGGDNQQSIKFDFSFKSKYDPQIGTIDLDGEVIYLAQKDQADKIVSEWSKTKKVSPEILTPILNNVLNKCNIQALILSKEMNLPAPIPLPKINPKQEEKEGEKKDN